MVWAKVTRTLCEIDLVYAQLNRSLRQALCLPFPYINEFLREAPPCGTSELNWTCEIVMSLAIACCSCFSDLRFAYLRERFGCFWQAGHCSSSTLSAMLGARTHVFGNFDSSDCTRTRKSVWTRTACRGTGEDIQIPSVDDISNIYSMSSLAL